MLIGLVRDSVMQCFCHSCRAPVLMPAATEIRCQEKSKGGLSYEVILAEPAVTAQLPKMPVTPGKNISAEDIEEKLKAAEDRRLSMESKKVTDWTIKLAKIEEASRKKDELNNVFIAQTKEALDAKMDQYEEKRESMINDIKEKLKIHAQEIDKTRSSLVQQKTEERKALEDKLKTAAASREENIKKMLERLKEHNCKLVEIRETVATRNTKKFSEQARIIENKLSTADMNRDKEMKRRLEKIQEHERRAEIVRQNKASIQKDHENNVTASSG